LNVTAKPRLVLHFDLNNTILMNDVSKGLNTVDNVARIVAKSAWGRDTLTEDQQRNWELAHDQLTFCEPEQPNLLANLSEASADCKICSYKDFIDAHFPKCKAEASAEEKAERDELRKSMIAKFSQAGGLGSKFRNTHDKMLKQLALPKGAKEDLGIVGDNGMEPEQPEVNSQLHDTEEQSEDEDTKRENEQKAFDKKMLRELYSEGRYHMIPSFFRTMMYLKKQKQEFSVVFRTFGKDLRNAVHEFDKFAKGEHPCFNGRNGMPIVKMDGAKGSKDFRFNAPDEQIGHWYRLGPNVSETTLVLGRDHERVERDELVNISSNECTILNDNIEIYQ